ncbi:MAG TPA: hypothetical protein VGZ52_05610, partial [Acidimicrobiales bacterium]|nr:hypothetical protein [Acidimicrobiales bacterium]
VLVLGADKWSQLLDASFYESELARDAAVATLPQLAVAPRHDCSMPPHCVVLDVDLPHVSSTAARADRRDLVAPEAVPYL